MDSAVNINDTVGCLGLFLYNKGIFAHESNN
jgi:hypothetical protein